MKKYIMYVMCDEYNLSNAEKVNLRRHCQKMMAWLSTGTAIKPEQEEDEWRVICSARNGPNVILTLTLRQFQMCDCV